MSSEGGDAQPKSLKDRIAMFNQPKAAAPSPPPKPTKPRVFKWKTSDETATGASDAGAAGAGNALNVAAIPPPAPSPTPGAEAAGPALTTTTALAEPAPSLGGGASLEPVSSRLSAKSAASTESQGAKQGFSAEDARATSGSLKDRIALLSGLKVDQPAAPGRAPKPWRKKTADPSEDGTADGDVPAKDADNAAADAPTSADQPNIKVDTDVAQQLAPGTDTPGEPLSEKAPPLPRPASPTDNLANVIDSEVEPAVGSPPSGEQTSGGAVNVALPSMPTRAKGPARKGRGGTATSAATSTTTSPVAESAPLLPSIDQSTAAATSNDATAPTIADIASPADGPKEFLDASVNTSPKEVSKNIEGDEKEKGGRSDETSAPPAVPPPPPPIASSGVKDESDEETGAPDFDEDDTTSGITRTLAKQGLDETGAEVQDEPVSQPPTSPPPVPATSRPLPPMPARIDTQMTSPTSANDTPLSPVNRRPMTRPPVPTAFQQASPPTSPSRPSYEGIEARRQSSMANPGEPRASAGDPEESAGDGEFANPAIDTADTTPVPPPVSKPFDTATVTSPTGDQPSETAPLASTAHSRHASMTSPSAGAAPPLPLGRPPAASPSSAVLPSTNEGSDETNTGAASAYRATSPTEQEEGGDTEEYEDPEAARRQALAKRMAAMGGMKIGMLPPMFGGGGLKRKPTQSREASADEAKSPTQEQLKSPLSPSMEKPFDPAPTPAVGQAETIDAAPTSPPRPVPVPSGPSYRPPAGAFVLPGIGKAPAVPPPPPAEEIDEELEEEIAAGRAEPQEEDEDEQGDAEVGDDTVTQPGQPEYEQNEEEDAEAAAPPPPLPSGRPTRMPPPPTGQSFIDVDTDTDVGSKRTSMTSSMGTGLGDTSAFPHPPGAAPHTRTISTTSRMSGYGQEAPIDESPEGDYEADVPPPPARPARAPPVIDTDVQTLASDSDTQVMQSPVRTASMRSNQSLPQTPMSPTGRQASFSQMSPSASPAGGSRRSSTLVGSSGGPAPPVGISHEYLAHLGNSAGRTRSKDLDGALATALNDIAYSRRTEPGNFGHPVWRTYVSGEKGKAPDLQINGRIEAGCIFSAWDAKFDKGLGRSSLKVGSLEVPHVGIVCEDVKDIKKAKVKVVELAQGRHHIETYKLDDIKLGTVEIRKLP